MIEFIFFLLGFLFLFFDISIVPALSSHRLLTDALLLYSLYLFSLKKEKSIPLIIFFLWMKIVWIPRELVLAYLVLYLVAFLMFSGILSTAKVSNLLATGLSGFIVFTFEFLLFKKTTVHYLQSLLFLILTWICLTPLLSFLTNLYKEKIKGKGIFV